MRNTLPENTPMMFVSVETVRAAIKDILNEYETPHLIDFTIASKMTGIKTLESLKYQLKKRGFKIYGVGANVVFKKVDVASLVKEI